MQEGQRRLAAIMFTDMVGYTALGQRNESLSIALAKEQRKIIRPILARHRGREVKTMGDAFLVEFPSALDAVRCAYDIQRATREFNILLPEERRVRLRVGIHLGDVVGSRGDISGDAVNVASRIESLAEDGGVCLTRQVFDHVQNKLDLRLTSLGTRLLKNVSVPLEVYKIEMPWEKPAAEQNVELDRRRVAVLPLKNMSPDPSDEYFADGMTEELITTLSGIGELTVIARTSVMQYKNSTKRVADVGNELGTGTVIEGSVRKAADKVRITVQMIDARSEGHLWAQSYDRQMDDIFTIQSDIAKKVADALKVKLVDFEKRRLERRPTRSTEAYSLYLKGRNKWNDRSKEAVLTAIKYFESAMALDPEFALAYSGLADCYDVMIGSSFMTREEALPKQKQYALKAVELDALSAEAHTSLAEVLMEEVDWAAAEGELKRAMELNPSYSTAHSSYAWFLSFFRKYDEALNEAFTAERLDPLSPRCPVTSARLLLDIGQIELAEEKVKKAFQIQPDFPGAWFAMFIIHRRRSNWEQCTKDLDRMAIVGYSLVKALRGVVLVGLGKLDEARIVLKEIEEAYPYEPQFENLAHIDLCLALGEQEKAVRLVLTSVSHGILLGLIACEPIFASLMKDRRVQELLKKVGLIKDKEPNKP